MKAIVFTSNTGTTEKYARLLADKTGLPAYSSEQARREIADGSEIIYLGWLKAGEIAGYAKAAKRYSVKAVCGVGMGKTGSQLDDVCKRNSIPAKTPLFTLQGGFDMNKLHGIYKFMMKTMKKVVGKSLAEKPDRTPEEDDMLDMMLHGGERVSEENLKAVLDWYENIRY